MIDETARLLDRPFALVLRGLSHLAVWTIIFVPVGIQLADGWRALGDDAAISLRSYQVFTRHSPLLGQLTQLSGRVGHQIIYDPGPALYWLLAIPVRVDPAQGALWGAGLACGVALSLAVEAAWAVRHATGAVTVAVVVGALAWSSPSVFDHIVWNPNVALCFFISSVSVGVAVAAGHLRWWPVQVALATVSIQAHLIYLVAAAALVLLAPVVALVSGVRPAHWRSLGWGIGIGIALWIPPLVQEVRGRPGNLTLLIDASHGQRSLGLGFGLRAVAVGASPVRIWASHVPGGFYAWTALIHGQAPAIGAMTVAVLGAISLGAWLTGHRVPASVATVALICTVSMAVTFARFPDDHAITVGYLDVWWWLNGMMVWVAVILAAWTLAGTVYRRLGHTGSSRHQRPAPATGPLGRAAPSLAFSAVLLVVLFATAAAATTLRSQTSLDWHEHVKATEEATHMADVVEAAVPQGPVVVHVSHGGVGLLSEIEAESGAEWMLVSAGWRPAFPSLALTFHAGVDNQSRQGPVVHVTVKGTSVVARRALGGGASEPNSA